LLDRVRELRDAGRTPKEIARALKMPPSAVAPLIRSVAVAEGRTRQDPLVGCWSLWLNATGAPAEVAARAGNSVHVLQDVYAHCTDGREDLISQQIEDALDPDSGTPHVSQCVTASGYTHRWYRPDACPPYVRERPERPPAWPTAFGRALPIRPPKTPPSMTVPAAQKASASAGRGN
jgi:hypothetical protein